MLNNKNDFLFKKIRYTLSEFGHIGFDITLYYINFNSLSASSIFSKVIDISLSKPTE